MTKRWIRLDHETRISPPRPPDVNRGATSMRCWVAVLAVAVLMLGGCARVPLDIDRKSSTALQDPRDTTAGQLFLSEFEKHPGRSGFILMPSAEDSFRARNGAAALADKTIDAQYYSWDSDTTGKLLINRLILAADLGVRVRLLLDDYQNTGRDQGIAIIDSHPNIEIRIFNPFLYRAFRNIDFLTDFARVNHRMHNKAFIADNAVAVLGGRNIGDHYFGVDIDHNFRDLDVFVVGPVVRDVSRSFDIFWNSELAVPIAAIIDFDVLEEVRARRFQALREWSLDQADGYPYVVFRERQQRIAGIDQIRDRLVWAEAEVLFDDPSKAEGTGKQGIAPRLRQIVANLKSELLIESAYFVPGQEGVELLNDLEKRGVDVRILTNSLASNDMTAAFSGYAPYRTPLLRHGVQLYELRVDPDTVRQYWSNLAAGAKATLHTKTLVFDRSAVFIGSMNLDPRSGHINTEIGLLIHSAEIAIQVAAYIELGMEPNNSYALSLDDKPGSASKRLTWRGEASGETVRYVDEPDTNFGLQFRAWILSLLPIEDQL